MAGEAAPGEVHIDMLKWTDRVRHALDALNKASGKADVWIEIESILADQVIFKDGASSKLFAHAITLGADGAIILGPPQEVEERYVPVTSAATPPADPPAIISSGKLLEAKGGAKFKVRAIRAGLSGNSTYYPDRVLREAAPLFDGARVMVKGDAEHLKGAGKHPENIIGRLVKPVFIPGGTPDSGEIQATMELLHSAGDMPERLAEAVNRDMANLYGLSIVATGKTSFQQVDGVRVRIADSIDTIESVDLIVEAGAGGAILTFAEARTVTQQQGIDPMKKFLLDQIRARKPDLLTGKDQETMTDEEVQTLFQEAFPETGATGDPSSGTNNVKAETGTDQTSPSGSGVDQPGTSGTGAAPGDIAAEVTKAVEAETHLREALGGSGLPQAARERIAATLRGTRFSPGAVDAAIHQERDYLARVVGGGRIAGLGGTRTQLVESQRQKTDKMLDVLLGSAAAGPGDTLSLRAAYGRMTGDFEVSGRMKSANRSIMAEALDSDSWSEVLGDAMTRRLLADYRAQAMQDVWRNLANIVPVQDFRIQVRTRIGGYGDLPKVVQGGAYQALSSPNDEKADYAAEKRGGTESVTLEMITNDDVGALRQIPIKLARAAKRTLGKFVLDLLRTNPTIYDGKALFHADHTNLGTAALDATSWMAARLAMLAQTESGSNEPLGIAPKYLWVPTTLEEAAKDLFVRNTNLDPTFLQTTAPTVVSVWYWTDPNDWFVSADKLDIPSIEIGFLGGNEEPEIFIQDNPTVGSLFTNDQVTYKIRHIYGGTVTDHRGLYGAIVA
ncbi:MAG: hypothetical protein HQL86_01940 [Magnetococcales bacterium]|nr:hypothetical protein [Magnetococcales bacterium]